MTLDNEIARLENGLKSGVNSAKKIDDLRKLMTAHVVRFIRTGKAPGNHKDEDWSELVKEYSELPAQDEGESSVGYHDRLLRDGYLPVEDPDPDEYIAELAEQQRSLQQEIEDTERQIENYDKRMENLLVNLKAGGGTFPGYTEAKE